MHVRMLGPLEVVARGRAVVIGGARLRALLIRLALDTGRPVAVSTLVEALWADRPPRQPEHAVQALVSRLRALLPGEVQIESVAGGYRLALPPDTVDAHRFEQLTRAGRAALADNDPAEAVRVLGTALALWHGRALTDVAELPFAGAYATRLDEMRITATETRIAAELSLDATGAHTVTELRDLITADPLRERLRLLLIRVLHRDGQTAAALAEYERYRRLLVDELGADPGTELRTLHLEILRGGHALTATTRPNRIPALPIPVSSFVGRERELADIAERLRIARLVTLVGPGGVGKTRLAITVAAQQQTRFPDGVALVELAALTDPGDLVRAVAAGVGVAEPPAKEGTATGAGIDRLIAALPAAPILIVLDNCEHLIDAVARFAEELLGRCPALHILATSREPLRIAGEMLCDIPSLEVPAPGDPVSQEYSAVRLFTERADAVRAGLRLDEGTAEPIADICRRLDGVPLALELAAAKLRVMSLASLRAGLDDRFLLLSNGTRTALPRHRTLRAVLDWDWELLDPDERRALARISVFATPFTAAAAAHLGVGVEAVESLVDKSLLQPVRGARFRVLETIRHYGAARLAELGGVGPARAAHAAYFRDLAERAQPHLRGHDQLPWLRTMSEQYEDLLAALRFSYSVADADTAARLGAALGMLWTLQSAHADAARILRPLLAGRVGGDPPRAGRPAPDEVAVAVVTGLAADDRAVPEFHLRQSYPDVAAAFVFHSILAGQASEVAALAPALRRWIGPRDSGDEAAEFAAALLALATGRFDEGLALVRQHLTHPVPWQRGMFWLVRSLLHANGSGMDVFSDDLTAAASAFEEAGERWGHSTALNYLAFARTALGDYPGAARVMRRALVPARELGRDTTLRVWLAMIAIHAGDIDSARRELDNVLADGPAAADLVMARLLLSDLLRFENDLVGCARELDLAAVDLNRGVAEEPAYRAMFGQRMGLLRTAQGQLAAAGAHCADAWRTIIDMRDLPMVAEIAVAVARLCLAAGMPGAAVEVLGAAQAVRGAPDQLHPDIVALTSELRSLPHANGEQASDSGYDRRYTLGREMDRDRAVSAIERHLAHACEGAVNGL